MPKLLRHSILFLGLFLLGLTAQAQAQSQKTGYVNTDYILSQMPQYDGIQQQLQKVSSEWNSQLKAMDKEIAQLEEDFESQKVLYTDEQKRQKKKQITAKVDQRQQFMNQKFGAKGAYFQKQKELLEPIQQRVFSAINAVAEREDIDFVFDRAQNSGLLYTNGEFNLNDQILQELGITLKESRN